MASSLLLPARPPRLGALLRVMDNLFPCRRAAAWDNVGLLIDTVRPDFPEKMTVFLTNDLTEKVTAEALREKADVIVTYHPTPFHKFNRVVREDVTSRILLALAANGVAVYAPHTACDAASGGVNDWLISVFDCAVVKACKPCDPSEPSIQGPIGAGRVATLKQAMPLTDTIELVKRHLGVSSFRVAPAMNQVSTIRWDESNALSVLQSINIKSVAVCAGSGGSVLKGVKADLYVTGEMSHHDVLAANHAGISVILADHTNTERGFLPPMKSMIEHAMEKESVSPEAFQVKITALDSDPLLVV